MTTLDNLCTKFSTTNPIVRYADDFVITAWSHNQAKEIKDAIKEHLQDKVNLTLSEEKTKISHITEGFNFLGFNFRKYKQQCGNFKFLIKPQKEKCQKLIDTCKEIIKNHKTVEQSFLIQLLNPKLTGWGMYYRHAVSQETFHKIDFILWRILYDWTKRRHPMKSKNWIIKNYYLQDKGKNGLTFSDKDAKLSLVSISKIPIKRFTMVNKNRVFDKNPVVIKYWSNREYLNAFNQIESIKRSRLFSKQKGICPHCKGSIQQQDIQEQGIHVHHIKPRSQGGKDNYSNLQLVHTECHREIHSDN